MEQKLTKQDILWILRWKLGRIKEPNAQTVSDDSMAAINKAVKDAGKVSCRVDAINALDKIPGIGLATATAILTACYPEEFTILDWRALETLNLFPSRMSPEKQGEHSADDWTAKDYINEYLPRVKEQRDSWECTLRDTDRALWGISVARRMDEIIRKSNVNHG